MEENYRLIPLTQGKFAKVSPHRFEDLMRYKWRAAWCSDTQSFYAARSSNRLTISMAREILGLGRGNRCTADHRDHDTLNNVDENLRIATPSQQGQNRRTKCTSVTGLKGVKYDKNVRAYIARISFGGKRYLLGKRPTAEAAYHELYVPAALKYHGEFACL